MTVHRPLPFQLPGKRMGKLNLGDKYPYPYFANKTSGKHMPNVHMLRKADYILIEKYCATPRFFTIKNGRINYTVTLDEERKWVYIESRESRSVTLEFLSGQDALNYYEGLKTGIKEVTWEEIRDQKLIVRN